MSSSVVPNFFEVALERRKLVVEDEFLLVEQAADQGRLAVVDGTAGEQTQRRQRGGSERLDHQK